MAQKKWYYVNASLDKIGPITSQALKTLADTGVINRQTTLMVEGNPKMFEAGSVQGLFPEVELSLTDQSDFQQRAASVSQDLYLSGIVPKETSPAAPVATPQDTAVYGPASQIIAPNDPSQSSVGFSSGFSTDTPSPWKPLPGNLQSTGSPFPRPVGQRARPSLDSMNIYAIVCGSVLIGFLLCVVAFLSYRAENFRIESLTAPQPRDEVAKADNDKMPKAGNAPSKKAAPAQARPVAPASGKNWSRLVANFSFDDPIVYPPAPPRESGEPREFRESPEKVSTEVASGDDDSKLKRPAGRSRDVSMSTEELVAQVEGSVALITGQHSSGSGFVVLEGIIATNSHVISSEEIDKLDVLFPSETGARKGPFKAKLLYEDPDRDLAFLEITSKAHTPLPIVQNYTFRRAQDVVAIGSPGRGDGNVLENAVSKGILSTQTEVDGHRYYQLNIAINVGNSGGPIFDNYGEVLGVVTLKAAKAEAVAYCIPPEAVNEALETVRKADPTLIAEVRKKHESHVFLHRGFEKLSILSHLSEAAIPEFSRSAINDFSEAIRRMPDNPLGYLGRGLFKVVLGNLEEAVLDFDQAAKLAPDNRKLVELRDSARGELMRKRSLAARGPRVPRFVLAPIEMKGMERFQSVAPGRMRPPSPIDAKDREARYQRIINKEEWIFRERPLQGKLIGYHDGKAKFYLTKTEKTVDLYVNRFSYGDIEDIRFYAMYHGIPVGRIQPR